MRRFVLFLLVVISISSLAEILDPAVGSLRVSATDWMSIGWNCAGISSARSDFIYVDVVYRTNGTVDMKSFSISYVQSRKEDSPLAGALNLYRVFSGYEMERLGASYSVSGINGSTSWGIGIGLERIRDEIDPDGFYSVFLEIGFSGKISGDFEYSFALRKIRLWSERISTYLLGDFGISLAYRSKNFSLSSGAMFYESEYARPFLGLNLSLGKIGLGLGGELVLRLSDLSTVPRVEGSIYFENSPLTFGVYGSYMLGSFSGEGLERELMMDTVLTLFTKVDL